MLTLAAFIFGAIVGSFLNVCIFRIPNGESIVFPSSHCQQCRKPIAWSDNIPIISFMVLRGRCRHCRTKISPQYVWIEVLTACLFVLFYQFFGWTVQGAVYLVFSLALVVVSAIDFRHRIIPESITFPGIALGLLASALYPPLHGETAFLPAALQSLLGILAGGGGLFAIGAFGQWLFKKEAMGGGDVMLLAMIGSFLGWQAVLWTIFVSALIGSVAGVVSLCRTGDKYLPYGPYLALAAFLYLFFGNEVIGWYLRFIGISG